MSDTISCLIPAFWPGCPVLPGFLFGIPPMPFDFSLTIVLLPVPSLLLPGCFFCFLSVCVVFFILSLVHFSLTKSFFLLKCVLGIIQISCTLCADARGEIIRCLVCTVAPSAVKFFQGTHFQCNERGPTICRRDYV